MFNFLYIKRIDFFFSFGRGLFFKQNQTFTCIKCNIQNFSQVVKVQLGFCNLYLLGSKIIYHYQKKMHLMNFICKLIYFIEELKKALEVDAFANINICLSLDGFS